MSEKYKLTIDVRPCKVGDRPYQWCATATFDFPIESRHGDKVTAVNVGSYSGWSAVNRLLDQPIVTKYLYELELKFLKENSMDNTATQPVEAAAIEATPETAPTQETPATEAPATTEAPAETADEPAKSVAAVLADAAAGRVVISPNMRRVFDKTVGAERLFQGFRSAVDKMMAETPEVTQGFRNHFHRLVNVSYKVEELFHNAQEVIAGREVDQDGDFLDADDGDKD